MAKHTPKRRGNNEGTISLRADGRWEGRATIGRDPGTGKLKRVVVYGRTREEAAEKLAGVQGDLSRGTFVKAEKITLGRWLETWLRVYKKPSVRPRTFDCYESLMQAYVIPDLGHFTLKDLRPDQLQWLYNDKLKAGLSARTVRLVHVVIHGALEQALKSGLVVRNVSKATSPPKLVKHEIQPLSEDQVSQLLAAARDNRLYPAVYLAIATGLRVGELLALRWQDIDLAGGLVSVRQSLVRIKNRSGGTRKHDHVFGEPKTKESRRTIPLPADVTETLKRHKARQAQEKLLIGQAYEDQGLVFCTEDGKPLHPRNFTRSFERMLKRAGLPHFRVHDLRHTTATLLLRQGENPKVVQTILGHNQIAITLDLYSHVSLDLERKAMDKLNVTLKRG